MEEWRTVYGYEGLYEVSSEGRVRSVRAREKIMRAKEHYHGYHRITLTKDTKTRHFYIHRLVAIAFLPNPDTLPIANHRDGNKKNNVPHNLEWVSSTQNTRHYYNILRVKDDLEYIPSVYSYDDLP